MRAPAGMSATNLRSDAGRAEADEPDQLMRAMRTVLARQRPASAAEALRLLRRGYPEIPLALRIAAHSAGSK